MECAEKIIKAIGGLLDFVMLAVTLALGGWCIWNGIYHMAILLFILHGIWCISVSLMALREKFGCAPFND